MSFISDQLIHRCDIIAYAVTEDVEYGKVNTETVAAGGVPCWFQPRAAAKRRAMDQVAMDISHVCYMDGVPTLDVQNILAWRATDPYNTSGVDRFFEVVGMRVPDEVGEYSIVGVREFDGHATSATG